MTGSIDDAFQKIWERWGGGAHVEMTTDERATCVGISIGLGDLFNDNLDGELSWMQRRRDCLNGLTSLQYLKIGGDPRRVMDILDEARGLR